MRSLTVAQIAHLLKCPGIFPNINVQGYCVDSRLLKKGQIFFALKGDRVDGHDYLKDVQKKGATAAIVSKDFCGEIENLLLLKVDDPLLALQQIARITLLSTPTRVVAITGSVGKTSTKEFIKTLLSTNFRVATSPGNQNSQIGLPLTILNHTTGEEEILILEMGMTEPGHLLKLVQIAPPEVAVLTTVALVHACHFDSVESIGLAKAEIFSNPHTRLGIIDRGIVNFEQITKFGNCRKISFSLVNQQADFLMEVNPESILIRSPLEKCKVSIEPLKIPGKHNLHNLLAAIIVARYFNVGWEDIKKASSQIVLPERRLQFISHRNIVFLNDSYNASELSVKAALETMPIPEGTGRKIAVLGSMLELGKFSLDCHRRVGEFALNHVDEMYCLGEECVPIIEAWKAIGRTAQLFHDRKDLVAYLRKRLKPADVVLLKGSRSKELWKVLEELELHFT